MFPRLFRFRREWEPPLRLRLGLTLLFCALTGLGLSAVSMLVNTQSIRRTLVSPMAESAQYFGAALLLALLALILTALTRSLFAGGLIVSAAALLASFVNYFKVMITATPLEVQDFALAGTVGNIAQLNAQYLSLSRNSVLAILGTVLWVLVLLYFSRPLRLRLRPRLGLLAASAAAFALIFVLLADSIFYTPLGVPLARGYSQTYVNGRTGFVLGLWRSVIYRDSSAADYTPEEAEAQYSLLQEYIAGLENEAGEPVNVIVILSESFFDPTRLPGVEYASDPIADYRRLAAEGVSGRFYTRTLGYGTVNIELELLTGVNTRLLPYGEALNTWPAERFEKLPAVPQILADSGYYTAFIHMYNDTIYNRRAFLPSLGFEDSFFSEDMAAIDPGAAAAGDAYWDYMEERISGLYYSDDYMTDVIIELFEQKTPESPVFIYAVSMENHSTYTADKYESYDFPFTSALTGEAQGALNAATQGIANASEALGRLCGYLSTSDEPAVVIFFGDHRPGLGLEGGGSVYTELGMCPVDSSQWTAEQCAELYSADYLIWANDDSLLPGTPGEIRDDSSNYLGLSILEAAGVRKPDFWLMLESMRESSIQYTWNYFVSAQGTPSLDMPDTLSDSEKRKFDVMRFVLQDAYSSRYIANRLF